MPNSLSGHQEWQGPGDGIWLEFPIPSVSRAFENCDASPGILINMYILNSGNKINESRILHSTRYTRSVVLNPT